MALWFTRRTSGEVTPCRRMTKSASRPRSTGWAPSPRRSEAWLAAQIRVGHVACSTFNAFFGPITRYRLSLPLWKYLILKSQNMFQTLEQLLPANICNCFQGTSGITWFFGISVLVMILMWERTAWSSVVPLAPQVYSRMCIALHDQNHCVPIKRPIDRCRTDRPIDRPTAWLTEKQWHSSWDLTRIMQWSTAIHHLPPAERSLHAFASIFVSIPTLHDFSIFFSLENIHGFFIFFTGGICKCINV